MIVKVDFDNFSDEKKKGFKANNKNLLRGLIIKILLVHDKKNKHLIISKICI